MVRPVPAARARNAPLTAKDADAGDERGRPASRTPWLGGIGVAAATLALLVATGPLLTITWDEAFVLGRQERVREWLHAVRDPSGFAPSWRPIPLQDELLEPDSEGRTPPAPADLDTRAKLFSQPVIEWFWPFARAMPYGHPPGCALAGLIGDVLAPSWEVLARARLGPMLLVSIVAGAIYGFVCRRWGPWAAAAAAGAWVLQPRPFAHWHFAHFDDVLVCYWVGSVLAFSKAVEAVEGSSKPRWGWAVAFGILAGAAANTKLTGWFLPIPFIVWTLMYRDRRGLLTLLIGGALGLLTLYLLTPPWWHNPVDGVEKFLRSNLTRSRSTKIPTMFLGRVILTPAESLPWYNTLVWTFFVTPVVFLGLAITGAGRAVRRMRAEPLAVLFVLHWVFLLVLRALPHTPGHDGERQFLAAFGCLALVVGVGAASVVERLGRWGRGLVVAALLEGAVSIAVMMPVPLSYYSPLVGGLPGATRLGMEPTYYWDSFTDDAIDWLNEHTPPGGKVLFPTYPTTWRYLRQSGRLKVPVEYFEPGVWTWYVLQNRPGAFSPEDRLLIEREGAEHVLVSKWGVPLLWAFPHQDLERARADLQRKPPP